MSTATASSIGQQLVDLCRENKNMEAIDALYGDDIVSIEAASMSDMPDMPARMEGIEAIRGKTRWWYDNHELHSCEVSGPFPHGDRFAVLFKIDVTHKPSGQRMQMEEMGLYTTRDGKIVQEEFFYQCPEGPPEGSPEGCGE